MKKVLLAIFFIFTGYPSFNCTTFCFKAKEGVVVFGRNFDFPVGIGHIEINSRGKLKTSFIQPPEKPFIWVSKYGSITFNQAGKEFPYGGMNEAGLVIEQMWLQEAKYPQADSRTGLSELQWIQYQLDNYKTVDEVIKSDAEVRISNNSVANLHFLVGDANGKVATIEYLDGKMVVHEGHDLPYPVLANCIYDHSLSYKKNLEGDKNQMFNDWTVNSSGRFATAASMIQDYNSDYDPVDYSFFILDSVAQSNSTQWSIVYDLTRKEIFFKTSINPDIQHIAINQFDFSCNETSLFANITDNNIKVENFRELTFTENYKLIQELVSSVEFLKNKIPEEANVAAARYFQSIKCTESPE